MAHHLIVTMLVHPWVRSTRRWIFRLGGIGFIPLGLLDASIIPVPGSMDVLTIVLSSRNEQLWLYYALMATAGSVIGAFATYRLARRGGKEMLARKFPPKPLERAYKTFEQWGFGAIVVSALLPPPMPMVPFVLAAGAMQYSTQKFLAALTLGRLIRFTLLAFLGARYGRGILRYVVEHGHPVLIVFLGLLATTIFIFFLISKIKREGRVRA